MRSMGIAHNGPMTSFTLVDCHCGREWYLCRDDIKRIAEGILTFDDPRPEMALEDDEKSIVIDQAKRLVDEIEGGSLWADLGQGYFAHFEKTAANYVRITVEDLGRKFIFQDKPFVLLGAKPKARKFQLVARNLINGRQFCFTTKAIEDALKDTVVKVAASGS